MSNYYDRDAITTVRAIKACQADAIRKVADRLHDGTLTDRADILRFLRHEADLIDGSASLRDWEQAMKRCHPLPTTEGDQP